MEFKYHQAFAGKSLFQILRQLFNEIVTQIQKCKLLQVTQAFNSFDLIVMQRQKYQVDVVFETPTDLLDLIILEIEVFQVLENLQVLDLGAHI